MNMALPSRFKAVAKGTTNRETRVSTWWRFSTQFNTSGMATALHRQAVLGSSVSDPQFTTKVTSYPGQIEIKVNV